MTIDFENPKHEMLANDSTKLAKFVKKAKATAEDILVTLDVLAATPTLAELPKIPWHPHPLGGKYKGCFAVWINKQERIIFRPNPGDDPSFRIDNYKTIGAITVVELCIDYHKR